LGVGLGVGIGVGLGVGLGVGGRGVGGLNTIQFCLIFFKKNEKFNDKKQRCSKLKILHWTITITTLNSINLCKTKTFLKKKENKTIDDQNK